MANPPRTRKRVRPPRRALDGSAFQKCDDCGVSVPVALIDMHECRVKKGVKRFKGKCEAPSVKNKNYSDQPRSAFQFFVESCMETSNGGDWIEINREAFEKWKDMFPDKQWPYIVKAMKVEKAYMEVLRREEDQMSKKGDDEADSAMVGKFVKQHYEDSDHSDSDNCYFLEEDESMDTYERRRMMCPWNFS